MKKRNDNNEAESISPTSSPGVSLKHEIRRRLENNLTLQLQAEDRFFASISEILHDRWSSTASADKLGPKELWLQNNAVRIRNAGLTDGDIFSKSTIGTTVRHVYVLNFEGDILASAVNNFKQEITAVVANGKKERNDCVVIIVKSGGGTVTGYGLAAAQIERIRHAGLNVVVCVDEVAASGGYMMATVADKIYASPFAILGSIGVVASIPNFHDRLEKEGIKIDEVTAGKYKRTLTWFKKPTTR